MAVTRQNTSAWSVIVPPVALAVSDLTFGELWSRVQTFKLRHADADKERL